VEGRGRGGARSWRGEVVEGRGRGGARPWRGEVVEGRGREGLDCMEEDLKGKASGAAVEQGDVQVEHGGQQQAGCPSEGNILIQLDQQITFLVIYDVLPVDDFFALGPYEVLLVRGQDAERVLLTRPGLSVHDVGALVHVDGALRQGAGLRGDRETQG